MNRLVLLNAVSALIKGEDREKIAGIHFMAQGLRAMGRAGKAGQQVMQEAGYPTAAKVVRYAPHLATGALGYLGYKSETGQKIKGKVQRYLAERKYRKMMEQQQRAMGY